MKNMDVVSSYDPSASRNEAMTGSGSSNLLAQQEPDNNSMLRSDNADAILAHGMTSLSLEERNRALEEIHGIKHEIEEDPEVVERELQNMEEALQSIRSKKAYDQAAFLSPKYVQDRKFRLVFLRADAFDAKKAAERMVRHFQFKLELFGLDKLVKHIEVDDMGDSDREFLMLGLTQYLTRRDRAGRVVLFNNGGSKSFKEVENQLRVFWYFSMNGVMDYDEASRYGIVLVVFNLVRGDSSKHAMDNESMHGGRILSGLPIRFASIQYCFNNPIFRPVIGIAVFALELLTRVRLKLNYGSLIELQYELLRYGIPASDFPMDDFGNVIVEPLLQYIEERKQKAKERMELEKGRIPFPHQFDVLLGRGVPSMDWKGNMILATMVDKNMERYKVANPRGGKGEICREILDQVYKSGGRFLKRGEGLTEGEWVEASPEAAIEKVGQMFRNKSRREAAGHIKKDMFDNWWSPAPDRSMGFGGAKRSRVDSRSSYDAD